MSDMPPPAHTHDAAQPDEPRGGCGLCALRSRRLFTGLLAGSAALALAPPVLAQDAGLRGEVGSNSRWSKLVPAEQFEAGAAQQYQQMLRAAAQQRALAGAENPQVVRLRAIAERIVPHATPWNDRAARWRWEVNLLANDELNAFCMPGGKIAFYLGILRKLQLNDDEVAAIMGHEVAHALREHARERAAKTAATGIGAGLLSAVLGLGSLGDAAVNAGGQLLTLRFSRDDETEADIVGMDLSARAGYDPGAGVSLWQKMMAASRGAPPQWMSTHPSSGTRIKEIQAKLPKVQPLYAKAQRPAKRFAPPDPA
jgi:predicted Zn-dependent protease